MQDAGAAAIELNIYYLPGDPHISGRDVEQRHLEVLSLVKDAVTVPVAVKLSPHFSSTGEIALALDQAGADGLVLFNRFLQPDIDPETLTVVPTVGLSNPAEGLLPRIWIALLHGRVRASLAATTGVESPADVAKYLLAGADVVMSTSALLRHGPEHATTLLNGLTAWMTRKGFASIQDVRGMLAVPTRHRRSRTRTRWLRQRSASGQDQRVRCLTRGTRWTPLPHAPLCLCGGGGLLGGLRRAESNSGRVRRDRPRRVADPYQPSHWRSRRSSPGAFASDARAQRRPLRARYAKSLSWRTQSPAMGAVSAVVLALRPEFSAHTGMPATVRPAPRCGKRGLWF